MKNNWETTKLGDVCDKITDGTHSTPTYLPDGIPFLSVKNLTKGYINLSDTKFVSVDEHNFLTKRCKPQRDDILYTKVGTTGIAKVVDIDDEFSIFVSIALLKINHERIYNKYLEHFLNAPFAREQAKKRTRGMANKNLVISDIKEIEIHFPKSLAEQQRIVAVLDATFTAIDKAKENAEKNLRNARELFDSYLQSVFANSGDNWEEKTLGEVCEELFAGGDVPKDNSSKSRTDNLSIPIFSNGEKHKGLYGYTNVARVTKPSITVSARGTIGYSEIREDPFYPAIRLIVLTPKKDILNLAFLKYIIGGIDFKHSGTSIPQLTVPMIKNYLLSFPSLELQQIIVSKLDSLSAKTKDLENIYRQKINDLDELKKSILQKAFNGEL